MNRGDFQQLAELHLEHAKALLDARLYSGSHYMCGYVVECALKACICKRINQFDFYPSPEESREAWPHDFKKLVKAAGLDTELFSARTADPELNVNWESVARDWSPDSRYEFHQEREAFDLLDAVSHPIHGVFVCLKRFW